MTYNTITFDLADDMAIITLNRPQVMNALSSELRREMLDAVRIAQEKARVLVITGEGRAFCSGQDLTDAFSVGPIDFTRILAEEYEPLLTAIAVGIYAAGGIVEWPQALVMMVAATAGGYGGARVARKIPAPVLRWGIVVTGLVMAGLFFAKG